MKFWVGVTDTKWYRYLRERKPEDVNFWQPSGKQQEFKVIEKGAPFLFKLKAPDNAIGGVGFFSAQAFLPISVAWDAFSDRNGCADFAELKAMIDAYRLKAGNAILQNPVIGARIWRDVQDRLERARFFDNEEVLPNQMQLGNGLDDSPRYRESILSKIRLGQGGF